MEREVRQSEKLLMAGLTFILLFMVVQDIVPLGSLNDVNSIFENRSVSGLTVVTITGTVQILLLLGLVLFFRGRPYPLWVKLWLIIHQSFISMGALLDWWIPYFSGYGAKERADKYESMFSNTHSFLPEMNGIVPNTLHVLFHTMLFFCLILTIYISLTKRANMTNDRNRERHVSSS
ncbi:hypothetical protein [Halobacillus andaensis]|uniref:hypothetical protein n=1 Tax=Halobacillus andaensis TaxID=1176239 RepID=UPI003D7235BB